MKPWYHNNLYKKVVALIIAAGIVIAVAYRIYELIIANF